MPADLEAFGRMIDATELFPSSELSHMTTTYFDGSDPMERRLTVEIRSVPIAVAYYAPERMTNGTWKQLLIAVHPEHQSGGIGRSLTSYVENDIQLRGGRVLLVEMSGLAAFERTRGFYRHIGHVEEARIRGYYDIGDDKVVFLKALA